MNNLETNHRNLVEFSNNAFPELQNYDELTHFLRHIPTSLYCIGSNALNKTERVRISLENRSLLDGTKFALAGDKEFIVMHQWRENQNNNPSIAQITLPFDFRNPDSFVMHAIRYNVSSPQDMSPSDLGEAEYYEEALARMSGHERFNPSDRRNIAKVQYGYALVLQEQVSNFLEAYSEEIKNSLT